MSHATARPRRTAAEQHRLELALRTLIERRITFNSVIGMRVESLDVARPRVRFDMHAKLVGHDAYGRLHGGAIATALDGTGSLALMLGLADRHPDETADQVMHRFLRMGTIDLRIDYLRPGTGVWFESTAWVTRLGGRIASTQMALHGDDGRLIATAAGAYVVS